VVNPSGNGPSGNAPSNTGAANGSATNGSAANGRSGTESVRRIPPPSTRHPGKENAFWRAKSAGTELFPLFPHLHRGAMVPAVALLRGGPDADYGRFFHYNTVDELIVVYATNGGLMETGQVASLGRLHAVSSFLHDETDPEAYFFAVVTQRQVEEDRQDEALIFRCDECNSVLMRWEFETTPGVRHGAERAEDRFPVFTTQWGSQAAGEAFNDDEQARTCSECGHVNRPFPLDPWGWGRYCDQCELVNEGQRVLGSLATAQLGGS